MAKASAGEVIVLDFTHQLVPKWNPFSRALGGPTTRPAWRIAAEPNSLPAILFHDEWFQSFQESQAVVGFEALCETHVVQLAVGIVQSEQQRSDYLRLTGITKAADHTIGGA
jgi:hypothetical protein